MAQRRRGRGGGASSMKVFYIVLAAAVVAGFGALAWVFMGGRASMATAPVAVSFDASDVQALVQRAEGIERGPADAPVRVIEFADYQCAGCATFATGMKPVLEREFIEPGLIRFTYFDYPITSIHAHAFLAARAARCAGDQDRYWDYHDVLYARQSRWSARRDPADDFVYYARELGLDQDQFRSCLRSDAHAEAVSASALLGEQLGVNSTPTVIVNAQRVQDWLSLPDIIRSHLGER